MEGISGNLNATVLAECDACRPRCQNKCGHFLPQQADLLKADIFMLTLFYTVSTWDNWMLKLSWTGWPLCLALVLMSQYLSKFEPSAVYVNTKGDGVHAVMCCWSSFNTARASPSVFNHLQILCSLITSGTCSVCGRAGSGGTTAYLQGAHPRQAQYNLELCCSRVFPHTDTHTQWS